METKQVHSRTEEQDANRQEIDKLKKMADHKYKYNSSALLWGITAGLAMGVYVIFLNLFKEGENIVLNFLKNIFLLGALSYILPKYRNYNLTISFFQKAMSLSATTTFYSCVTLVVIYFVVGAIEPTWTFNYYAMPVDSIGDVITNAFIIFFEVLVFGIISSFIWVQWLKGRDEHVVDNVK